MSDNWASVLNTFAESLVWCVLLVCLTYCSINRDNLEQERWLIENQSEAQQ